MIRLSDLAGMNGGRMGSRKPMGAPQPGGFLGEPSQSVPGGPSMDPANGQPFWSSMRNDLLTDANGNRSRNNPGLTSWDFMRGPNGPIPQGAPQDGPVPQPAQGEQSDSATGDPVSSLLQRIGQGGRTATRQGMGASMGGNGDIMQILQQMMGRRGR